MNTQGGYLISRIHKMGGRLFDRLLSEADIDAFNGAQGRILYVLWQEDGISISEIAQRTSLANTTLTSMLDRMVGAELIRREPVPGDRRRQRIVLTEKSRALREDYERISQRMNDLYYKGFTEEEYARLEGYLLRILHNLEGGTAHEDIHSRG